MFPNWREFWILIQNIGICWIFFQLFPNLLFPLFLYLFNVLAHERRICWSLTFLLYVCKISILHFHKDICFLLHPQGSSWDIRQILSHKITLKCMYYTTQFNWIIWYDSECNRCELGTSSIYICQKYSTGYCNVHIVLWYQYRYL